VARPEKVELVSALTDKVKRSQSVILADFKGLTVEQMTGLRNQLRAQEIEFKVIKNRLGKRAIADAQHEACDTFLKGNTVWAFGLKDAVAPAKILMQFAKDNEKLVLKGGLLEGKRIDSAGVQQLAAMPGRKELLARMAGDLKSPATKIASVMNATLTKFGRAFTALAKKLEEAGASA